MMWVAECSTTSGTATTAVCSHTGRPAAAKATVSWAMVQIKVRLFHDGFSLIVCLIDLENFLINFSKVYFAFFTNRFQAKFSSAHLIGYLFDTL